MLGGKRRAVRRLKMAVVVEELFDYYKWATFVKLLVKHWIFITDFISNVQCRWIQSIDTNKLPSYIK